MRVVRIESLQRNAANLSWRKDGFVVFKWRVEMALGADERVVEVSFTDSSLSVALKDGRTITVPLTWYPTLLDATPKQRMNWKIAGGGLRHSLARPR
jgi:hypothetical protein